MSKGDRVTRTAYNNLQTQVSSIMGVGSNQSGYGQDSVSRQANIGEIISSTLLTSLRTDMVKAWTHQTNTAAVDNYLIGPPNLKLYQSNDVVTDFITQYSDFINNATTGILARRALANAAQLTAGISVTNTQRTTAWGGAAQAQVVSHTVTLTFGGYTQGSLTVSADDHIRVFFNSGGSIQVSASRAGGTVSTKNTTWTNMLAGFGLLSFRGTSSSITGVLNSGGTLSSATGFYSLTVGAGLTTLLSQPGPAGVYAENDYIIAVSRPTTNTLVFTVTFRDDDVGDQTGIGAAVDEQVDGTLTSIVQCTRASGANVDVPAPSGSATAIA